jgi:ATP synthase proteolipid subunit
MTNTPSLDSWELLLPLCSLVSQTTLTPDLGAAYGTAKSGVGISSMGVLKPELIFKSIVPIIMAGILGIYGLIVSVILIQKGRTKKLTKN